MKTVYIPYLSDYPEPDFGVAIDGSSLAMWLDLTASLSTLSDESRQLTATVPTAQPQQTNR